MLLHGVMLRTSFVVLTLAASTLPTINAVSCPGGDTAGVIKDGKTCAELVPAKNAECYVSSFETTCCESCNNVASNNPNCLYGDSSTCFEFLCPSYTSLTPCCATCASFITTASTVSSSTSVAASDSSSASTATFSSTSASDENESSGVKSNGGVIAGAVVGSVIGVSAVVGGAVIAFKFLKNEVISCDYLPLRQYANFKPCRVSVIVDGSIQAYLKKDNKVEDEASSITSSGIPEKLEGYPSSIPERLDICTVLQDKLDKSSDRPEKLETLTKPTVLDTHDDPKGQTDTNEKHVAFYETKNVNSGENVEECPSVEKTDFVKHTTANFKTDNDSHPQNGSTDNHTGSENNSGKRNLSLPTLIHSYSNAPPLHQQLPPIISPAKESGLNIHNKDSKLEHN